MNLPNPSTTNSPPKMRPSEGVGTKASAPANVSSAARVSHTRR